MSEMPELCGGRFALVSPRLQSLRRTQANKQTVCCGVWLKVIRQWSSRISRVLQTSTAFQYPTTSTDASTSHRLRVCLSICLSVTLVCLT